MPPIPKKKVAGESRDILIDLSDLARDQVEIAERLYQIKVDLQVLTGKIEKLLSLLDSRGMLGREEDIPF